MNTLSKAKLNDAVSVGGTSTALLAINPNRRHAVIVNDDASVVLYIALGAAAVAGSGIRLNPGGGSYLIDSTNLWTGAINGITAGGAINVTRHESE